MLNQLTHEQFEKLHGKDFRLEVDESSSLELSLAEVRPLQESARGGERQPFSLTFRGPAEPALPQQIYPIEHPDVGRLEIFLVPIGPDPETKNMQYEAVFT